MAGRAYVKTLWLYKYTTPQQRDLHCHSDPPVLVNEREREKVVTKAPGTGSFSQRHSAAFYDPRRVDLHADLHSRTGYPIAPSKLSISSRPA